MTKNLENLCKCKKSEKEEEKEKQLIFVNSNCFRKLIISFAEKRSCPTWPRRC